jgi:hypothetical protein
MDEENFEAFLLGFFEAIDFTDITNPDNEELNDKQLSLETTRDLTADCRSFLARCYFYIMEEHGNNKGNFSQAGHDFWFTRCGHGAGFWDGDWKKYGDLLTRLSENYGNVELYAGDDGKIYR